MTFAEMMSAKEGHVVPTVGLTVISEGQLEDVAFLLWVIALEKLFEAFISQEEHAIEPDLLLTSVL